MTNIRGENRLIALVEKGKPCRQSSAAQAVHDEFAIIEKAREKGFSWKEISEAMGFPGRDGVIRGFFSREISRRKKT